MTSPKQLAMMHRNAIKRHSLSKGKKVEVLNDPEVLVYGTSTKENLPVLAFSGDDGTQFEYALTLSDLRQWKKILGMIYEGNRKATEHLAIHINHGYNNLAPGRR